MLDATNSKPIFEISPFDLYPLIAAILILIGDYVLIPVANWLDKRAIFNYRARFGLKRDRRRQAKRLLEQGMALFRRGTIDEADAHFGAALKVTPHLVESLSREQQQSLVLELEGYRKGGLNATNLLLQLWAARKESSTRK
jgi:hypothetical protein